MKIIALSILLIPLYAQPHRAQAQAADTVLSLQEAKARLMNYNLGLLASCYEIDIAKAKVIQAKVWNNPNFIINGDMYNQETNEYFALRNQSLWQSMFLVVRSHIRGSPTTWVRWVTPIRPTWNACGSIHWSFL